MPATVKTEIVGVKDTIKALRRVDPEFRKEFNKAAKDVVAPMVSEAKALYPKLPLSGMARSWTPKAFSIFPWQINKVKTGVKVKTSTRRDKNAVLYVSQGTPSAVVFETVSNNLVSLLWKKFTSVTCVFILRNAISACWYTGATHQTD